MRLKFSIGVVLAALLAMLALAPLAVARMHASASTTVTVKASEFKFVLSKKAAPHGVVICKVKNVGKIVHDFKIAGKKTAHLAPGKSATLKLTLKKGTYKFVCDPHASSMKGSFTIK